MASEKVERSLDGKISWAMSFKKLADLRVLLDENPDVSPEMWTHHAIQADFAAPFQMLMERGATLDFSEPKYGRGLLIDAIRYNCPGLVQLFLDSGADANVSDELGRTPLMHAIVGYRPEFVELLLARGADPHPANNDGQTAMSLAADLEQRACIKLLEKAGVKPLASKLTPKDRWPAMALIRAHLAEHVGKVQGKSFRDASMNTPTEILQVEPHGTDAGNSVLFSTVGLCECGPSYKDSKGKFHDFELMLLVDLGPRRTTPAPAARRNALKRWARKTLGRLTEWAYDYQTFSIAKPWTIDGMPSAGGPADLDVSRLKFVVDRTIPPMRHPDPDEEATLRVRWLRVEFTTKR